MPHCNFSLLFLSSSFLLHFLPILYSISAQFYDNSPKARFVLSNVSDYPSFLYFHIQYGGSFRFRIEEDLQNSANEGIKNKELDLHVQTTWVKPTIVLTILIKLNKVKIDFEN